VQYYINPLGIQSLCLSAVELGPTTGEMSLCKLEHASVEMNLRLSEQQNIRVPLVQGSGFISAIYSNLRPKFTTTEGFLSIVSMSSPSDTVRKWRIWLNDGNVWLLYAISFSTYDEPLKLNLTGHDTLEGSSQFNGLIQVTKVSCEELQFSAIADTCAGTWATSMQVSASYDADSPSKICYTFDFQLDPRSRYRNLLMYALPHHVASFDNNMKPSLYQNLKLQSTTKGVMMAVVTTRWTLQEHCAAHDVFCDLTIPTDTTMRSTIEKSAREEIHGDPSGESNLDSMYFAGKALDKYANLCWVICTVLKDVKMTQDLLVKVKAAFARFAENQQRFPLTYESEILRPWMIHALKMFI
jgi:endo-1,3(4)-beta-glucanase